jgi:hypothetical protein
MPKMKLAGAPAGASVTTTLQMPSSVAPPDAPPDETKPDFWEYIQQLTPEQWKNHVVYITRENPKTGINGIGGYLTKLQQSFDADDIKTAYGGYEFSYILKEGADICKKCRRASGTFRVEAPPKFDSSREAPGQAASNGHGDGNAAVIQQFIAVLREELARSRENSNGSSSATEEAIKLLSSASDRAMEVITKQIPQAGDPAAQLNSLLAAAEKIAAMRQPAPASGGFGELGALLIPVLKTVVEKLLTPTDPLEQLTKLAGVFEVVEKLRGGGGGGRADWKSELVAEGIPALKEVVGAIAENRKAAVDIERERRARAEANARAAATVQDLNAQRAQVTQMPANARPPAPMPAAPANGHSVAPATAAAAAPPHVGPFRVVPMSGEGGVPPPAATQPLPVEMTANADEFLKGVKIRLVEMLNAGEETDFIVDAIDGMRPDLTENLIKFTPPQITAFFKQDPILHMAVEHPRWNEFLAEAREYLAQEQESAPSKPN